MRTKIIKTIVIVALWLLSFGSDNITGTVVFEDGDKAQISINPTVWLLGFAFLAVAVLFAR